jgi:flagellar L-ring protein precursor FlgH
MPRRISKPILSGLTGVLALSLALAPADAFAKKKKDKVDPFAVTMPAPPPPPPANGSIFQGGQAGYVPLTSGGRAGQVGDIITIQLVERTAAKKSNAASTQRGGSIGLSPPTSGPLAIFDSSDIGMGGDQQFSGKGDASQSNTLSGEVSVTIAAVYPNGTMLVRGEKLLTLNRGDERVQISGLVRAIDISPDNRVLSTRVANADIRYVGKGEIARASRQGWLQRFFSIISPF